MLATELFSFSGTSITGSTLLVFAAIVVVTFWFAGFLQRASERMLVRRGAKDEGTAGVISRLLRYMILVVGISAGVHNIGIDLSALFAAGAFFAVAMGFAMQNIVANFISGVILLAERVIKPGDVLQVDDQVVRVTDMGIRATVVRTLNDEDLVLPNSMLVQSTVKNFTLRDRLYRLRVVVGVEYSSDMRQVRKVIEKSLSGLAWRSKKREPVLLLADFGASSVDFEASVWIEDPWNSRKRQSDLREAIWWALEEAEITIAFPQVDVHFDESVTANLGKIASPRLCKAPP